MPGSGEEAIFRVVRSRSFVGTVIVQWAVSNGTLVFPEVKQIREKSNVGFHVFMEYFRMSLSK